MRGGWQIWQLKCLKGYSQDGDDDGHVVGSLDILCVMCCVMISSGMMLCDAVCDDVMWCDAICLAWVQLDYMGWQRCKSCRWQIAQPTTWHQPTGPENIFTRTQAEERLVTVIKDETWELSWNRPLVGINLEEGVQLKSDWRDKFPIGNSPTWEVTGVACCPRSSSLMSIQVSYILIYIDNNNHGTGGDDMTIRVSHLQFFLISELFQAGMNVCHTQEQ